MRMAVDWSQCRYLPVPAFQKSLRPMREVPVVYAKKCVCGRDYNDTWAGLPSLSSWRLNPVAIRVMLTCYAKLFAVWKKGKNFDGKVKVLQMFQITIFTWEWERTYLTTEWRIDHCSKDQVCSWVHKVIYNFCRSIYLQNKRVEQGTC